MSAAVWAVRVCDLGCTYPIGGPTELFDEEGAFCRACAWTCDQTDPHTYRAISWPWPLEPLVVISAVVEAV